MEGSTAAPTRQEKQPATTEVAEVAPGVLRTQLPISLPGLGHVNCYLLEDARGIAVVDPGLPGPQSWRALVDRLKRAGCKPKHVHTVIVTHSHPDHFGGAGILRDRYGAEVIGHRRFRTWFDPSEDDTEVDEDGEPVGSTRPRWGEPSPWRDDATTGPPRAHRLRYRVAGKVMRRFVRTPRPTRRVDDAEVITLAGREWVALHTPGHTEDHLCLHDPAEGVVLSGDHVLPTITPHISGLAAGADPLSAFFGSLEKVATLEGVRQVLPAHGHPFADLAGRAHAIREHHEERLQVLRDATAELGTATVEQLSQRLFRQRSWGPMAESETFAHLEHLRLNGEAEARKESGALHYRLT